MSTRLFILAGLLLFLLGCDKSKEVPVPSPGPNAIITQTKPLPLNSRTAMEGIYTVAEGSDYFGSQVVLKWNRTGVLIANENGKHCILQAGHLDSVIFLQGYWRDGYSDETGLCNLYIAASEGGVEIMAGQATGNFILRGAYGEGNDLPDKPFTLQYQHYFPEKSQSTPFYILAHRAGGRTSDRLPVSENSIAMINFTEQLGTTGIEIDVRLSSDGVAFLYHDGDINIRLTQKGPLAGDISAYNWFQLSNFVRLIHGERIPTLGEALNFVIDSTELRFVYLDMKAAEAVPTVAAIQKKALQRAKDKNRDVVIVMGIPATDIMDALMQQPDYQTIPSLCELSIDDLWTLNSYVWAPRWTLGTQNDLVQQVQDKGKLAVCWTIDSPDWIETYLNEGRFNGLLTNFPYVVAYYHYTRE